MKRLILITLLLLAATAAQAGSPIVLDGIDISPAVDYFRPMITPLRQSVTVYNWSQTGDDGDDDSQLEVAKAEARTFWKMYGDRGGSSNMYGYGLYAAIDPVATRSYGGYWNDDWRVLVLELPKGTRLLDFPRLALSPTPLPAAAEGVLSKFGCGSPSSAEALFTNGGAALSATCQKLARKIFADILQVDVFSYWYTETDYKVCSTGLGAGQRAFVVTNESWMTAKNVRFYTAKSNKNLEERTRIETLFLKAGEILMGAASPDAAVKKAIAGFLINNPDFDLERSRTKCSGDSCVMTATFCDAKKNCTDLDLPPLPRPGGGLITSAEAAKSSSGQNKLLWADLEGQPKTPTLSVWMKKNQFGCDGNLPYETQP